MDENRFPTTIYLDSNAMFQLKVGANDTNYLQLREWVDKLKIRLVIPEVVYLEWKQQQLDSLNKSCSCIGDDYYIISQLTSEPRKEWKVPTDYEAKLDSTLAARLKDLGIEVIPTTQNLDLGDLVKMAVKKIRPFEEKGEKGFRDTVILRTIAEDMKSAKITHALFITNDLIYKSGDVQAYLSGEKLDLIVCDKFQEASGRLSNVVSVAVKEIMQKEKEDLKAFVGSYEDEIFRYVKDNTAISEDFVTKGGFLSSKTDIFGEVQSVTRFDPTKIKDVYAGLRSIRLRSEGDRNYSDREEPISISVEVKIKVVYRPLLLMNRPMVRVADLPNFKEVRDSTPVQYYGDPKEDEFIRSVSVDGVVEKNENNEYQTLKLERVFAL